MVSLRHTTLYNPAQTTACEGDNSGTQTRAGSQPVSANDTPEGSLP